jgi:protease-4
MKLKEWHKLTLLVVGIFLIVFIFMFLVFGSIPDEAPPLARDSFLVLNISGEIPERVPEDALAEVFGAPSLSVQSLQHVIRKAKIDNKIKGIIIRPGISGMGWAKTEEIKSALEDFKTTGKPVYAYIEAVLNRDYYLACVADSIFGLRTGIALINGFHSTPFFLKGTFDKLGIEFEAVAHGKYKNAPDQFTRENMSEAQREVINSLLDDYFDSFISHISSNRNIPKPEIRELIDQGFFNLEEAKKHNLIDSLIYYNDFKELLKERHGRQLRFVSMKRYRKIPMSELGVKAEETFAVIYGVGTIVVGSEGAFGQDDLITSEGMANSIKRAADNQLIKAIILRIDSPGGSGIASDIIWKEVERAREKKPVVVSMSDVAASGGYYIAMAADSIVAHPLSIIGSIGVFSMKPITEKLNDKIGLSVEELKRGKNADIFSSLHRFTPEQRKIIRKFTMDFYEDFVSKVAEGRKMTYEEADKVAQGRVWSGSQGLENGLIDKLGDFKTAVNIAKKMVGIPVDEYVILAIYPRQKTLLEKILSEGLQAKLIDPISQIPEIHPVFRSLIKAVPHFRVGEPLFLSTLYIDIN